MQHAYFNKSGKTDLGGKGLTGAQFLGVPSLSSSDLRNAYADPSALRDYFQSTIRDSRSNFVIILSR